VVSLHFYITRILPVGLCMALGLHFGNLAYLHLTVSFIQILKSLAPVITMLALFLAKIETPTKRLICSVLVIAAGTVISSLGEVNFSAIGVVIAMSAEVFEATRLVLTQLVLTSLKFHPKEGLMYLAPACCFWLGIGFYFIELRPMLASGYYQVVAAQPWKFVFAAGMGFAVNAVAYIIIQTASSLSLKVLGTVKNAFVVWLGIFLLGDTITMLQATGYSISIAAFYWYQKIKMEQMNNTAGRKGTLPIGTLVREDSAMFEFHKSKMKDVIAIIELKK
jgi:Triose-phosphate Transporter family